MLEYEKFIFQMRLAPVPMMTWAAPILAWLLPLVEFVIVGLLIIGLYVQRWQFTGFLASFFLLLIFQFYITAMLLSGLKLPCTCGGFVSGMSWVVHLWFNGVFMLIALLPVLLNRLRKYNITIIPLNIRRINLRE